MIIKMAWIKRRTRQGFAELFGAAFVVNMILWMIESNTPMQQISKNKRNTNLGPIRFCMFTIFRQT